MIDFGKATPRPWLQYGSSIEAKNPRTGVIFQVCECSDVEFVDTAEANAALIACAVNVHAELVAALKAISTHWANQYDHPNMEAPMYRDLMEPASQTDIGPVRL
jgi:hypothetical protein